MRLMWEGRGLPEADAGTVREVEAALVGRPCQLDDRLSL
jgi:hypothetical protein